MTDQYIEAAGPDRFDTAVTMAVQMWSENSAVPLENIAARVVKEVFCMCVTEAEDEIEHQLSSMHAALVAEVVRRTRRILRDPIETPAEFASLPVKTRSDPGPLTASDERSEMRVESLVLDVVDLASDESFPASDPPAWINGRDLI